MKRFTFCMAIFISVALAMPAFGGVGQGLSGPHYNLNIIGVKKDKTVPSMTDSNRHTIFVPLDSGDDVLRKVKIYYVRGEDFQVLDGNATDDNQATIQVPFEFCEDYAAGCEELLSYDVYAVGLGKPNGAAIITAECTYSEDVVGSGDECTDTLLMGSFGISRDKGKPHRENITEIFRATGCLDFDDSGACDTGDLEFSNIWIFNIMELSEYFWDYDNNGLKLMQMRFYPTTSGSISFVK
jgi:hypothetical protein